MNMVMSGISDAGYVWKDGVFGDFVNHYRNGKGRPVRLRDTGHLRNVVNEYRRIVIDDLKRLPTQIANKAREKKNGSFWDDFYNTYEMQNIVFSLGETTIGGEFSGKSSEKNGILTISGTIDFYLRDEFKDPLDRYDIIPGEIELPWGTVYQIHDNWRGKFEGSIYLKPDKSKYRK